MLDQIPKRWLYTSFRFREDLNSRFFHKNPEISGRFLHTKVSVSNDFFTAFQDCCCCFPGEWFDYQGQVPASDLKNWPRKPWKFVKYFVGGGKYYFLPKMSFVQKLTGTYWACLLNIAKENLLKRLWSITECKVCCCCFVFLF